MRIVPPGQMVFGLQLPIQSQSTTYVADWETKSGPAELAAIARTADEAGYFYIAVCDHVALPPNRAAAMSTTWYDTIATLGWLAGITSRVRLMSHVWVAPYRHPLLSAKAFATLDHLSNGRVIIGVGAGHVAEEFALLDVDFAKRGRRLDEAIDAMKVALSGEFSSFEGPTWSFDSAGVGPRPIQTPRPPIWIGGSSPAAIRRAALKGDGWLPQGTPLADMPAAIKEIHARREEAGGDAVEIGAICLPLLWVGEPAADWGQAVLGGSAEKVADGLRKFKALGVEHLQIRFKARSIGEQLDQMQAFASDVAPLVNQ